MFRNCYTKSNTTKSKTTTIIDSHEFFRDNFIDLKIKINSAIFCYYFEFYINNDLRYAKVYSTNDEDRVILFSKFIEILLEIVDRPFIIIDNYDYFRIHFVLGK